MPAPSPRTPSGPRHLQEATMADMDNTFDKLKGAADGVKNAFKKD